MEQKASDFSAQAMPNQAESAQALVQHPELGDRRLDLTLEEAARLGELAMKDPVTVTIKLPDVEGQEPAEPLRYHLTPANFAKLATRATVEVVMEEAKPLVEYNPRPNTRATAPTRDYNSLEWAGQPHRGTISDDEARLVRENLTAVNERLAAAGKRLIDPENPEIAARYGFGGSQEAAPAEPQLALVPDSKDEK